MLLHVTGTPGTGKTCFTRWLEAKHGYIRWPSGAEPDASSTLNQIKSAVATSSNVVLDWNVPPDGIHQVEMVQSWGFETWWFDGDRETRLKVFLGREDHPATPADYERYMEGVKHHWQRYQSLFDDRHLDVLQPGPTFMPNEERFAAIDAYPRSP
jgi:hypothetical protein